MADVDFSHAVLEPKDDTTYPMSFDNYLALDRTSNITNSQSQTINSNGSRSVISNTPTKVSVLYTGSLITSGTEFYVGYRTWRVSNISFSDGDTYSFVIDIETSGNT